MGASMKFLPPAPLDDNDDNDNHNHNQLYLLRVTHNSSN